MSSYSDRCVSNIHAYPMPAVVFGTYINGERTMFCVACADDAEAYGLFTTAKDNEDDK